MGAFNDIDVELKELRAMVTGLQGQLEEANQSTKDVMDIVAAYKSLADRQQKLLLEITKDVEGAQSALDTIEQ